MKTEFRPGFILSCALAVSIFGTSVPSANSEAVNAVAPNSYPCIVGGP